MGGSSLHPLRGTCQFPTHRQRATQIEVVSPNWTSKHETLSSCSESRCRFNDLLPNDVVITPGFSHQLIGRKQVLFFLWMILKNIRIVAVATRINAQSPALSRLIGVYWLHVILIKISVTTGHFLTGNRSSSMNKRISIKEWIFFAQFPSYSPPGRCQWMIFLWTTMIKTFGGPLEDSIFVFATPVEVKFMPGQPGVPQNQRKSWIGFVQSV